jgi:hypothetical protein
MTRWLAILALAACSLPKMPVGPHLAAQQPYRHPTFGSRGDLRFGEWRVQGFKDSLDVAQGEQGPWFPELMRHVSTSESNDAYSFRLESSQPPATVRCRARTSVTEVKSGRSSFKAIDEWLRCVLLLAPDGSQFAILDLTGDGKGEIDFAGRRLAIEARSIGGYATSIDPAGYGIKESGRDVAVAQVANGGAAWIAADAAAPDRGLYAAAVAALLLYRPE